MPAAIPVIAAIAAKAGIGATAAGAAGAGAGAAGAGLGAGLGATGAGLGAGTALGTGAGLGATTGLGAGAGLGATALPIMGSSIPAGAAMTTLGPAAGGIGAGTTAGGLGAGTTAGLGTAAGEAALFGPESMMGGTGGVTQTGVPQGFMGHLKDFGKFMQKRYGLEKGMPKGFKGWSERAEGLSRLKETLEGPEDEPLPEAPVLEGELPADYGNISLLEDTYSRSYPEEESLFGGYSEFL